MILIGPIEIPLRLDPRANKRDHPQVAGRKAKRQRNPVRDVLRLRFPVLAQCISDDTKLDILLVRVSADELDPWDNLPMSLKSVLDGVCDFLGIDDRSNRLRVYYGQDKPSNGLPGYQAVKITIAERESCPTCDGIPMILWSQEKRDALKRGVQFIEQLTGMSDEIRDEYAEHNELACLVSEIAEVLENKLTFRTAVLGMLDVKKWYRIRELAEKLKVEL